LRIAGTDRAALQRVTEQNAALNWREVEPNLEDVFIHLLTAVEEDA